ncbi:MAG: YlbF family regulator [Clostridia bacterium]|nr:YlbF family regulator [Clostridia bacterium]
MEWQFAEKQLADALKETPEYQEFKRAKEAAFSDEMSAALLREYGKLQTKLQMFAVTGRQAEESEVQRFQQMSGLLYATPSTSAYLMAQLRLQKLMADVFNNLSQSVGLPIEMPSI